MNTRSSLLQAGRQLSDALFAYQLALEKGEARKRQLESLRLAVEYTKALLRYTSNTNYVDVLMAEQGLLTAQISGVNDRLQQLTAVVRLYRVWRRLARAAASGDAIAVAPLWTRWPRRAPVTP